MATCSPGSIPPHQDLTQPRIAAANDPLESSDHPNDPGCTTADDDTRIDFPSDPGCTAGTDNDELDDCPDGPTCPACGNGVDDDGDGFADYPADPGCAARADEDESSGHASNPKSRIPRLPRAVQSS